MFPYRKILELHSEEVSLRSIATITQHSRQKVTEVIKLAEKRGIIIPLDEEITDPWLEDFLYPEKKQENSGRHLMDFDKVHEELAKPNVTLTLLHDEYVREAKSVSKIPYAYRTFTEHYHNYALKYKATMRIRRKPGEILEVDWAGKTLSVIDPDTGENRKVYVFIATLPCSQLFYVEGSYRMDLPSWIRLHQHSFDFFGGSPQIIDIGKAVDVRVSDSTIEIYFNHLRAASHQTLYGKFGQFATLKEHMPQNHRLYLEQTPEEALKWASDIGDNTLAIVTFVLNQYDVEKQALNAIFTLKKLERKYTTYEIERACRDVLNATNRPTVKSVQTIIQSNKKGDELKAYQIKPRKTDEKYGFTRGASYYGGKD